MKLQFRPFLVILALLAVPLARAQSGSGDSSQSGSNGSSQSGSNGSSQSGSTESSPQDQSSNGPQPAFTHPENNPPLALLDEVTSHNDVKLGMGVSVAHDTNAAAFSAQSYSQTQGIFTPSIQLTQTRPKLTWTIGAAAGLTTSNIPGYQTYASTTAQGSLLYQISQRWQLSASDNFLYTSDPFQQYTSYSSAPTYNQPNSQSWAGKLPTSKKWWRIYSRVVCNSIATPSCPRTARPSGPPPAATK